MAPFIEAIYAGDAVASFGHHLFDSELKLPGGRDWSENVELTLKLRIHFNFVDPTQAVAMGSGVVNHGKTFVPDASGWLFPVLPWSGPEKKRYSSYIQQHGQQFWDDRFCLMTPDGYSAFDYCPAGDRVTFRPNVRCRFRLDLVGPKDNPHKVINVFNLNLKTKVVFNSDPTKGKKKLKKFDSYTFRSDDSDYDSLDTVMRVVASIKDPRTNQLVKVRHDTIAHELGHALGQAHIAFLLGDATCSMDSSTGNDHRCYDGGDPLNVMGGGELLRPENAYSWYHRIEDHTGVPADLWAPYMGPITPSVVNKP
jgi:hypothetical protein